MIMSKLTDNDKKWRIFTWGKWSKSFSIRWIAGDDDERGKRNRIWFVGFGYILQILMPPIIPPRRRKILANWDDATVNRLGRNWYYETFRREFGFSLSDMGNGYDFLQIFYGAQTHSSSDTKNWCFYLPWKQWRIVRHSIYDPIGLLYFTDDGDWQKFFEKVRLVPKSRFEFQDFDGSRIVAVCHIEEREWHRGTGWFGRLKHFYKPMIRRSLDIKFSAEVGTEKGSWKGGMIGHGIDMLPGESPIHVFQRYCQKEQRGRNGRTYKLTFIREL